MLDVRPGCRPEQVLPTLLEYVRSSGYHVDGHDLDVVAGTARLSVRFVVPDENNARENARALTVADSARQAVTDVALPGRVWVLRRQRGRWVPVNNVAHGH